MNAQVAIAAGYFPAYARIPRKAQRKADEFIRKFRHDPKQPSIHYEPIGSVVDKQLRSVRVGDDYRAIIRAPETGNVFILLYIDHHDEAYRWAEGKQLQVHPSTGTLQFFDVDEASAAVSSIDTGEPTAASDVTDLDYEEKRLFSDYSDDQLFVGGVPRALLPAVRALYTEADLDKLTPHLPREAADLLTGLAAGYSYEAVIESILDERKDQSDSAPLPSPAPSNASPTASAAPSSERPSSTPQVSPSAVGASANGADIEASLLKESTQAQFRLIDESFDLDKALAHPLDAWRVYLHPSQRKIVRAQTKGPMRVTGGAGTGKTVVAMHRAAFLLREVFQAPDDRILVTTFTRNLAADIRLNLEKLLEPEDLTRVEVTSIDAWAAEYLKARGRAMRPVGDQQRAAAWNSAFDLFGVSGFDLQFCKTEWEAVIQEQGITDEQSYVRAVRHHRGTPLSRAERRKLWELFEEYRSGLESAGVAEYPDILRAARQHIEEQGRAPLYRSVIVDEAQDFSRQALSLVRSLAGPERGNDLLLVGDAHQRIYGRTTPLSQCGINIRGRRSRELRLNYRTTAAICRWSMKTLGSAEYDDLDGGKSTTQGYVSLRKGAPPSIRHFETLAEERAFIVKQLAELMESGVLPEEICVVARTKQTLEGAYAPALQAAGIDFEVLEKQRPRSSTVRLATMHRVKGLEFPVMFVGAVNDGVLPLLKGEVDSEDPMVAAQAEQRERCLLYVAASRARDRLFVTSYGRRSPFLEGLDGTAPVSQSEAEPVGVPKPERVGALASSPTPSPSSSTSTDLSAVAPLQDPTPLADWPLPTRMANWLHGKGVQTVGELLSLDPSEVARAKNMGRKSIADTDALIRERWGASWRQLRSGVAPAALGTEVPAPLSEDLPWILEKPVASLPFPVRFFTWAHRVGITTLGELARCRPLEVMQEKGMGRGTVGETRAILEKQAGRRWEELHRALHTDGELRLLTTEERQAAAAEEQRRRLAYEQEERERRFGQGFFRALKDLFVDLETVPRMILTRRAGLRGQAETLEEIGATLGVTRERVRQIEKKTWDGLQKVYGWVDYVEARCREIAPDGAARFEDLERHPWWSELADEPDAVDYFCDRLLEGRWRVIHVEGEHVLADAPEKDFSVALAAGRKAARSLSYPQAKTEVRAVVLQACQSLSSGLAELIWQDVEQLLSLDGEGETARALAYGTTKNAQIIAYLEVQDGPIPVGELNQAVGRVSGLPDEVFLLARGRVGLERHFPEFQKWKAKVAPVVIRLIQENGPERQWSCMDLLPSVRDELDLPEWLEHWHLGAILRRSEGIEYLGRLRVALPGAIEEASRIHAHVYAEELLREAGEPMQRQQLVAKLREKLDVTEIGLAGVFHRPNFLRIDKERWGLTARDLPGGIEAMSEALDEIEGVLERRQRGLSARFVQQEVAKLSEIHAHWSTEMCLSIVRGDPRFRLSISGTVGLADWEDTRVPTKAELVKQALEKSDGRVTIQAVSERIAALYGDASDRVHLGQLANRFGWRLDGDALVRGE